MQILEPTSHSVCCCGDNTTTRIIKFEETRFKVKSLVKNFTNCYCSYNFYVHVERAISKGKIIKIEYTK